MARIILAATVAAATVILANPVDAKISAPEDRSNANAPVRAAANALVLARFGGASSPGGGLDDEQSKRDFRAGPFYTTRGNRFDFEIGRRFRDFGLKREFDRDDAHRKRQIGTPVLFPRNQRTDR